MREQCISKTALPSRVLALLTCLAVLIVLQVPAVAAPGCKSKACRSAAADRPPTIDGVPSSQVTAGQAYSFTPTASDPEGKSLSFSIVNRPPWLSFSASTGRLSGTPASSAVGEYVEIRIQVSDGRSTATLGPFSITVLDANRPPNISGTPPTAAREGQAYEFTPMATDADGDTLTFSISNRPPWASFNSATGRLTGTPGTGSVGTYANITISVSDGALGASLSPFSIAVQQVSLGSATLSWQAPTLRSDGSPLTNLAGYRIRYGTSPGNYSNTRQVANPGVTTIVIDNLPAGTYYFVMTAYDSDGRESEFSAVVSKSIS
jgi:hypothetical protein